MLLSMECQDLIMSLLTLDPRMRPSIYEVQSHPWVMGLVSFNSAIVDRVIESESPDPIKTSHHKETKTKLDLRKKLPAIPKRL